MFLESSVTWKHKNTPPHQQVALSDEEQKNSLDDDVSMLAALTPVLDAYVPQGAPDEIAH